MKLIEIIVHCYAERLPLFASMLTAQISSVLLSPPKTCAVLFSVCTTESDALTRRVIQLFNRRLAHWRTTDGALRDPMPVTIQEVLLEPRKLFRRAIGRNQCALASKADIVHFTDADYLYGAGFLDGLAAHAWQHDLIFPYDVYIHRSHAAGDAEIDRIVPGQIHKPDWSLFMPWGTRIATGGLQIVRGDVARAGGYCAGSKFLKPARRDSFQDTMEDACYRKSITNRGQVDLPGGLFRMRHTDSAFETKERRLRKQK